MNKNEIIGYKDYYYDKYEYSRIGPMVERYMSIM